MLVNVRAAIDELPEGSVKAVYVFNPREGQSVPAGERSWDELLNSGEGGRIGKGLMIKRWRRIQLLADFLAAERRGYPREWKSRITAS